MWSFHIYTFFYETMLLYNSIKMGGTSSWAKHINNRKWPNRILREYDNDMRNLEKWSWINMDINQARGVGDPSVAPYRKTANNTTSSKRNKFGTIKTFRSNRRDANRFSTPGQGWPQVSAAKAKLIVCKANYYSKRYGQQINSLDKTPDGPG